MDWEAELLKARERFEEILKTVDTSDLEKAAQQGWERIIELGNNTPEPLKQLWNDIQWMVDLIKDYWDGTYREIPWASLAAIVAAIIYFVSPLDAIPDFIPVIGYLDDATVIGFALAMVKEDLLQYKKWKESKAPQTALIVVNPTFQASE
ncbi:MAG: DUF1232 domain-containing protein [SAR324 cluster bacterium]|nr:DUF1232 domain-containing protein [SAR324 cluster bacterium]